MNFLVKFPSNFRGTYPIFGKALVATSGILLALSAYSYSQASGAEQQIAFRKQQLKLPVYTLTEQEHINPPWNRQNLGQWLYRRVKVTGRVIHRNACLVPHTSNGGQGFEYVVPLLVKEQKDRSNAQGLIVSKGFIPFSMRDPGVRYRVENAKTQSFVGFVSQLDELKNSQFTQGNSTQQGKLKFTCADCQDFAKAAEFVNPAAAVAVVEELREKGSLDERNYIRRELDCEATANYPYAKTESGALQLRKMPWHYKNDAKKYLWSSLGTFILGASIF